MSPVDGDGAHGVHGARRQLSAINYTMFAAVRDAICSLFDDSYRFYCVGLYLGEFEDVMWVVGMDGCIFRVTLK